MNIGAQMLALWMVMVLVMTLGWLWQKRRLNAGIVDVLWSVGVGVGAALMALTGSGDHTTRSCLAALAGVWAARLAWHLWRRVSHEQEDGRYRQLRQHWQTGAQWKFFLFFQAQAVLVLLFALPFVAVAGNPVDSVSAVGVALTLWVVSVGGESIADAQLARFRRDPANRGKTCRAGLWRYSRHPNYFFEWLHWFSYVALAWGAPLGLLAWSGPVVMYVFLRWISGIPYTEAQGLRSRGEDYREYQRTTPMLIPWFPKSSSSPRSVV